MRYLEFPALVLCSLLVAACASQPKELPRAKLAGFTITPPREEGWVVARQTPGELLIGKPGRFNGETFSMQATVVKLPPTASAEELVKYAESRQRSELDPKRLRLLKIEVRPRTVNGASCALAHLEAADRSATETSSFAVNKMLETLTLTCAHPKDGTRGIISIYSHGFFPEDKDPEFFERGSTLVENLEFGPL